FPFFPNVNHYLVHSKTSEFYDYNNFLSINKNPLFLKKKTKNVYNEDKQNETSSIFYKKHSISTSNQEKPMSADKKVVAGGHSIGVQLHTLGVVVVGHHLVEKTTSPGENADIEVGDIILEIEGETIKKLDDVKQIIHQSGKHKEKVKMKVKRGN